MLQMRSFKIEDGEAMSAFLKDYRLAAGASVMVSNGGIVIPFEDGEDMTINQKRINLQEDVFKEEAKVNIILHSQRVLEVKLAGAEEQLNTLNADIAEQKQKEGGKDGYDKIKMLEGEVKRITNVINQFQMSMVTNQAELTSSKVEINIFKEEIAELK